MRNISIVIRGHCYVFLKALDHGSTELMIITVSDLCPNPYNTGKYQEHIAAFYLTSLSKCLNPTLSPFAIVNIRAEMRIYALPTGSAVLSKSSRWPQ